MRALFFGVLAACVALSAAAQGVTATDAVMVVTDECTGAVHSWPPGTALPADGCHRLRRFRALSPPPEELAPPPVTEGHLFPRDKPGWPRLVLNWFATTTAVARFGPGAEQATVLQGLDAGPVGVAMALDITGKMIPGWPSVVVPASGVTVPGAADIDGDGRDEVLINVGDAYVLAADGTPLPGWPFDPVEGGFQARLPVAARLRPDEPVRVIATNGLGIIHVLDAEGRDVPGWPARPADLVERSLVIQSAVGDVTGDGRREVVVADVGLPQSKLFVYDAGGQLLPGYPLFIGTSITNIQGPTLADLDGDGDLEILVRAGRLFAGGPGPQVMAFDGDGTLVPGWPQFFEGFTNFGVAAGDVDDDGRVEVFVATIASSMGLFTGAAYLWNHDGTPVPGWPRFFPGGGFDGAPTIADVDGDGRGDLIATGGDSFAGNGVVFAWKADGSLVPRFPLVIPFFAPFCSATVTDLEGDGLADLTVSTEPRSVHWFDLGVPYRPEGMEWPTRAHDMARTNAHVPPVERRPAGVHVVPPVLAAQAHPPFIQAVLSLPDGAPAPAELDLVKVDGQSVGRIPGTRADPPAQQRPGHLVFRFDGETVRNLLGEPGRHGLVFRTEALGGLGGVQYQAEATVELR